MSNVEQYPSDIAFTPTVKTIQARKGSRENSARSRSCAGRTLAFE